MLNKEQRLEVLLVIEEIIKNTALSKNDVIYDDDSDCIYSLRKIDLLKTIDRMKSDL